MYTTVDLYYEIYRAKSYAEIVKEDGEISQLLCMISTKILFRLSKLPFVLFFFSPFCFPCYYLFLAYDVPHKSAHGFRMVDGVMKCWSGESEEKGEVYSIPTRHDFSEALHDVMYLASSGPVKSFW